MAKLGENSFTCPDCEFTFTVTSKELVKQLELEQEEDLRLDKIKLLSCPWCGYLTAKLDK